MKDPADYFLLFLLILMFFLTGVSLGLGGGRDLTLSQFCESEHTASFERIDSREYCLTEDDELIHIEWLDTDK